MRKKPKHCIKKRKFKHISAQRIKKYVFQNKNIFGIIIILFIIISVTVPSTYAYLTESVIPNLSLNGGNELKIQNGTVELNLDNDVSTSWNSVTPITPAFVGNTITDPLRAQEISYGPVYIMTPSGKLNSNINIQTEYTIKKSGGTTETTNNSSGSTPAEPFEVIVGDLDNFNGSPGTYDFYGGTTIACSLDIFPQSYDAQGTDRRMVPSGFYQVGTKIFTIVNAGYPDNGLRTPTINATATARTSYYVVRLNAPATVDGVTVPSSLDICYDGYTDKALIGTIDHVMDGVNWRYLQKVKPITFKYNTIADNKGVSSVNFQLFTNDMQSGASTNQTTFALDSTSYFKVYLSKKNGVDKIEIPEFSKIINKYAQSGPVGNIISLNLPEQYLSLVKSAGGLNEGLELLIDDNRIGISGDTFVIDFAKMTVNKEAAKGATNIITAITGKVVDSGNVAISGVKVATGDGKSAITAADGTYTINGAAPGILSLTFSHYKYKTDTFVHGNVAKDASIDLKTSSANWHVLYKGLKSEISAQEKLNVVFNIQKCDLSGNPIAGEDPILLESKDLNSSNDYKIINTNGVGTSVLHSQILKNLTPGSRYKLTYKLILKSYDDIGDIAKFDLLFSSRIKAKLTQENNPSWTEDGLGSDYLTSVDEPNSEGIITPDTEGEVLKSEIYFERPNTSTYWSLFSSGSLPSFYLNGGSALSGSKTIDGNEWYKYSFGDNVSITPNSKIKVTDVGGTRTSGDLYYFSTQKVFICTN